MAFLAVFTFIYIFVVFYCNCFPLTCTRFLKIVYVCYDVFMINEIKINSIKKARMKCNFHIISIFGLNGQMLFSFSSSSSFSSFFSSPSSSFYSSSFSSQNFSSFPKKLDKTPGNQLSLALFSIFSLVPQVSFTSVICSDWALKSTTLLITNSHTHKPVGRAHPSQSGHSADILTLDSCYLLK